MYCVVPENNRTPSTEEIRNSREKCMGLNWNFWRGGGSWGKSLPWGGGGGYGYFLEPHIVELLSSQVAVLATAAGALIGWPFSAVLG